MASEPDDNPFARNSVWPKMPQAPFRVGPLPKADVQPPKTAAPPQPPPAEPERVTITPLFTRPLQEPPSGPNLAMGGAAPRAAAQPAPAPAPPLEVRAPPPPQALPPQALPPEAPPPAADVAPLADAGQEPPPVELAEVVVTPLQPARPKPRRRRSPLPAIAATVVGLAGLAGLAYLFTRPGAAPALPAPPPTTVLAAPVTATPTPPAVVELPSVAVAPIITAAAPPPAAAPRRVRSVAPRAEPEVRVMRLPSDAARATEEAITAPVLALPIAPPPPPTPERAFRPPPAADPNAPIRTQRPY